jgi:hypothetical protein
MCMCIYMCICRCVCVYLCIRIIWTYVRIHTGDTTTVNNMLILILMIFIYRDMCPSSTGSLGGLIRSLESGSK